MKLIAKLLLITAAVVAFVACGGRRNTANATIATDTATENVQTRVRDTMKIDIDPAKVASMRLILGENGETADITKDDIRTLAGIFRSAKYDTLFNSGIMARMVTPDHTPVTKWSQKSYNLSWMQIWRESGRVLFDAKWYLLPPAEVSAIEPVLAPYHKTSEGQ